MKLFLLEIHWSRYQPLPETQNHGVTTCRVRAASLAGATWKARQSFFNKHGAIYRIDRITEQQDPAGLYQDAPKPEVRDCGSGHPYGICPKCGKAHGHILMQDGKLSPYVTATL